MRRKNSRILDRVALHSQVLVIAVKGDVNDWTAYIGPVPGIDHDIEEDLVLINGNKLTVDIAKMLFGWVNERYAWRE
jgi:hypothetical protein